MEKKSRLRPYARVKSELKRERYLDFLRRGDETSVGFEKCLAGEETEGGEDLQICNHAVEDEVQCCQTTSRDLFRRN